MPPETDDVRALVERAKQGDREAFEELYLLHFDQIYSYLQLSVGNKHDAEDLTNQTFVKMIESIDRFPAEERHLLAATVSVPARLVDQLKRELDAVQERILDLCGRFDGDAEQVLQVHLVLFPLSDRAGEAS